MPPRREIDDTGAADQQVERERIDAGPVVEEMPRRIDVRAGVGAHDQPRDVRAAPSAMRLTGCISNGGLPG